MRKARGVTQKELAEKLRVHQTAVTQWESGKTHPRFSRLMEIAEALDCSVEDLLRKEG